MIALRKSEDRGQANHGWLHSYHTFSFGSYYDPQNRGFRSLRVMNEDRVAAGQGFGTHGHSNMEILSYVLSGTLEHKDSMGHGRVLEPGEFQLISAGTGITHSEFNPSRDTSTHFYQIWLLPNQQDLVPSYEQKRFDGAELANSLRLVASPSGMNGSIVIHQNASIYLSEIRPRRIVLHDLLPGRFAWLQVLRGDVTLNDEPMATGDGAAISDVSMLRIEATTASEIMLLDLS